jgi:hypothetical protein
MLVFRAVDMAARLERLRSLGLAPGPVPASVQVGAGSALLEAPGGAPLLLLEATE